MTARPTFKPDDIELVPTLGADLRAQLTRAKPYHLRYITKQRVLLALG
jgi:hypothetical protein